MKKKILILIVVMSILVVSVTSYFILRSQQNPSMQDLQKASDKLGECKTDADCPPNYTCECTGIIPACEYCEGGRCIYTCVENSGS